MKTLIHNHKTIARALFLATLLMLSVKAQAGSSYYNHYVVMTAQPTGAGKVYISKSDTDPIQLTDEAECKATVKAIASGATTISTMALYSKANDGWCATGFAKETGSNTQYDAGSDDFVAIVNYNDGLAATLGSLNTGIDSPKTSTSTRSGDAYNVVGQNVDRSYRGIVIRDGKKYVQR